ncbi:hypothetical protein [Paenibacillus sp. DMB5]|nr:hypothetical protein [Paenibacillus sp. DMB5]
MDNTTQQSHVIKTVSVTAADMVWNTPVNQTTMNLCHPFPDSKYKDEL